MTRPNPWDVPGWSAIRREAELVRELLGSGATSLGRANFINRRAEYYLAFFALSVGVERLAKLILVADYALTNSGALPDQSHVRTFGHNIKALISAVGSSATRCGVNYQFPRPTGEILDAIVDCLSAFADANRGRYANFQSLGDINFEQEHEPVRQWWQRVAELILKTHFEGKPVEKRALANAEIADAALSERSIVLFFDEVGSAVGSVYAMSLREEQTQVVQKFSRLYMLQIIRWLAEVFGELAEYACVNCGYNAFFGHHACLRIYKVNDSELAKRKIWPGR